VKHFLDEDFFLNTATAKYLYHGVAARQPIFDYHCHLSVREIYENRPAENIARLWLSDDHYKWRLMRANGVPERFVTGDAPEKEKFRAYAETLSSAIGNPLYLWSHLELKRYFDIETPLTASTADEIWTRANERIRSGGFAPRELIRRSGVAGLYTVEDPADDLSCYERLGEGPSFPVDVLPAFRPEKAGEIWRGAAWRDYLNRLSAAAGVPIGSYGEMKRALSRRMDAFAACGCAASDHGVEGMPFLRAPEERIEAIFARALAGETPDETDAERYLTELLLWLAGEYARRGWVMELHIGPVRARNTRMTALVGRDRGFDSAADHPLARPLGSFLDELDQRGQLPRMVLFCLNPRDNLVLASTAGDFQDEAFPSKIQFGAAWWMNDHRDGMAEQMRTLANQSVLGRFIGMLTDSRSFLSYPRHEYFRRVLCDLLGGWVESGEYPNDLQHLGRMVEDICFHNVRRFFGLEEET